MHRGQEDRLDSKGQACHSPSTMMTLDLRMAISGKEARPQHKAKLHKVVWNIGSVPPVTEMDGV